MPKKKDISLKPIVKELKRATVALEKARSKAMARKEKVNLAAKIKSLRKIEKEVIAACRSRLPYNITVSTN